MPPLLDPTRGETSTRIGRDLAIAAVLIHGARAWVDHGALHGRSVVENGLELASGAPAGERHVFVWIAFKEGAFHGAGASQVWIDKAGGRLFRDPRQQANAMALAARGGVDLSGLKREERATLRAFLQSCEPLLWDRAPEPFKRGLKG
jgi:hypothetical protein